jgi:solute carrier family 13 (sodium-dependent dicarboxylate transporter), member 2/3/5
LPWGIVLLFGGGFALAHGFVDSGLTDWLGVRLQGLSVLPPVLLVLSICLIITFLTELTSNTATTQMALPVLASVAAAVGVNPLLLMVPATFSASCAFMLPVATPPNAIVFGTDMLTVREMARTGVLLNLFGAVVITVVVWLLGGVAFGVPMDQVPVWAVN